MATGVYNAHRENQRECILEAAEDLFINKGVEQVTMGDIATASRLTRATVYKYFSNKEGMASEIFKNVTRGWAERDERESWNLQGSAYERIERFVCSHFDHLIANPREARFIAEFDYLYSKKMSVKAAMKLFADSLEGERRHLMENIRLGQEEGSVRVDMAPEALLASVLNFNSGMMGRLGELGDKVEGEFGIPDRQLFRETCRIFLDGIKPQGAPRKAELARGKS